MRIQQRLTYEIDNNGFIRWLASRMSPAAGNTASLNDNPRESSSAVGSPLHQYTLPKRNPDYAHFPAGGAVTIPNLWQAARNYRWKGATLQATGERLARLADQLKSGYLSSVVQCVEAAQDVLRRGGVYRSNGPWIAANPQGLISSMQTVAELQSAITWPLQMDLPPARMNSGFTKIYALQLPGFLIYDSRVAAALALLVLIYASEHDGRMPPVARDLRVMAGRTCHRKADGIKTCTSESDHLRANLAANWLIGQVFTAYPTLRADWQAHTDGIDEYRALEAALFMLGYDIGAHPVLSQLDERAARHTRQFGESIKPFKLGAEGVSSTTPYIPLCTLATGVGFKAYRTSLGFQLHFGGGSGSATVPSATLEQLVRHFAGQRVAIGTSRTSPPKGSLGEYLQQNLSKTALASYIAPLLLHLGLADMDDSRHLFFQKNKELGL